MELYVVIEPFVKPFHLALNPLLPLMQNLQHAKYDLMVSVVFGLESLENCDDDSSDRCYDGGKNQRPVAVHVTPQVRDG